MKPNPKRESVSPARCAAFDILSRVETERAFAAVLLARHDQPVLSREDRGLAQEIVLGVLRWRRALDYFIERYSNRPVTSLDLPVLISLRMGIYQIRHLTRVPHSASVNESVNLVKRARTRSAAGLVNAVLRSAVRGVAERPGEGIGDPSERASIELSHPAWVLGRWEDQLGEDETRALALANNSPAGLAFRVNTLRTSVAAVLDHLADFGVTARDSSLAPGAFVATGGPASPILQFADQGSIYLQDEASQLVSLLLEARQGDRVLDLCAAPGSKSSHIAILAHDQAVIVACDLHPHRLSVLREACRKLGIRSVEPVAIDAARGLPFAHTHKFDRVLVDAPCSGTGTLRGNPEIKWRLSPSDIANLATLQATLLNNGAAAVAAGGRLVYSTCSLEPEENEGVVKRFVEADGSFQVIKPAARHDLITGDGFVRTFPHRHGSDGFFAAVLEKTAL